MGIIDPATGQPDTTKIDRNMVNKLALISISKQRKLINFLFYWEEELVRWRLLSEEENEIAERLDSEPFLSDNERIHLARSIAGYESEEKSPSKSERSERQHATKWSHASEIRTLRI